MIEKMVEFSKTLDEKAEELMEKIKEANPTSDQYRSMLENYSATMAVSSTINRTLMSIASKAKEGKKDESNN
jgi:hypothetical protein